MPYWRRVYSQTIDRLIQDRDRELVFASNNPRRSTAWIPLGAIHRHKLFTDEELALLRPELSGRGELIAAARGFPGPPRPDGERGQG
jgi:hypothetical protein